MTFTFEVSEQEANLILAGLGELPAKVSLGLIQKLQAQAGEQAAGKAPSTEAFGGTE